MLVTMTDRELYRAVYSHTWSGDESVCNLANSDHRIRCPDFKRDRAENDDYNRHFAKSPRHDFDVHRPLETDDDLAASFTWRELRRVSKSLTVQYFI